MKLSHVTGNAFLHACIPPLLIFAVLAKGLWFGSTPINVPLTLAIFLIGAGGGVISTYFRLKNIAPETLETNAILQIYISPVVAGLLGWVSYAFFLTGMMQGPLFPSFTGSQNSYANLGSVFQIMPATSVDAAKALLWAFVAGFSEKLIPNILDRLASQMEQAQATKG